MSALTLLSVPVGNKNDITLRALEDLKSGKSFLVEDTRNFMQLLNLYEISVSDKKIEAFHDHNEQKISFIIKRMNEGEDFFLVSDAGSPLISDPAHPLIKEAIKEGHIIDSRPGVTSVIAALEVSGAPPIPFQFHGFLPRQNSKIELSFEKISSNFGSHIFFESPHRIFKTLEALSKSLPESNVYLCRELTKKFQSIYRFKAKNYRNEDILDKGEFVLIVSIEKESQLSSSSELLKVAEDYLSDQRPKKLSKLLAEIVGRSPKDIYNELNK